METPLPWFDVVLPLPYRPASLVVLGAWLWGLNLHGFAKAQIDTSSLIRYPTDYESIYRFAMTLSLVLIGSMAFHWYFTIPGEHNFEIVPNLTLVVVLLAFIFETPYPWLKHIWPRGGRARLLSTFRRCMFGRLAKPRDEKFGDVLLADALTSYAKPISELYVVICVIYTQQATNAYSKFCGTRMVVPLLVAVPFIIRFSQCWRDNQMLNALKYSTAFPMIAFSTAGSDGSQGFSIAAVIFGAINASYGLWWDIYRDWDLDLRVKGLRPVKLFRAEFYWTMIVVDLLLRSAWALPFIPFLQPYIGLGYFKFMLEVFEILRRWLWNFFRVEAECVRIKQTPDILLGDVGPRIDED